MQFDSTRCLQIFGISCDSHIFELTAKTCSTVEVADDANGCRILFLFQPTFHPTGSLSCQEATCKPHESHAGVREKLYNIDNFDYEALDTSAKNDNFAEFDN